jgi:hypothetical protein
MDTPPAGRYKGSEKANPKVAFVNYKCIDLHELILYLKFTRYQF